MASNKLICTFIYKPGTIYLEKALFYLHVIRKGNHIDLPPVRSTSNESCYQTVAVTSCHYPLAKSWQQSDFHTFHVFIDE